MLDGTFKILYNQRNSHVKKEKEQKENKITQTNLRNEDYFDKKVEKIVKNQGFFVILKKKPSKINNLRKKWNKMEKSQKIRAFLSIFCLQLVSNSVL